MPWKDYKDTKIITLNCVKIIKNRNYKTRDADTNGVYTEADSAVALLLDKQDEFPQIIGETLFC